MDTSASDEKKSQESQAGKARVIVIGIVLAIIGSLICSAYAKETITNYAGFIMLLAGIATFVIGTVVTATAYLKTHFEKTRMLCLSIWSIGIGIVLAVVGFIVGGAYAGYIIINGIGMDSISY